MIDVVIVAAAIVTLAAGLCGHATQPWPLTPAWQTVRARHRREARCTPAGATNSPSGDYADAEPAPRASQGRARPLWSHSQPLNYEEVA